MKIKTRRSSLKARKMKGFRRRMASKSGRKLINRQRARACGRPKRKN